MAEYAHPYPHHTDRPPLIGLIGKARAGKDTFARRLVEKHGYQRLAFADALKALALGIDPIVVPGTSGRPRWSWRHPFRRRPVYQEPAIRLSEAIDLYGEDVAKANIPEIRRFWQRLGEEAREKLGADVWCDMIMHVADLRTRPIVITDVRYLNEADAVSSRGGKLVRIVRPGAGTGDANANHASETELDDWPAYPVIENRGTVPELHAWADWLAVRLTDGTY